eukprot:GILK01001944.1.p1 GENE.GILK01001944.1~~GILK01001944.1.p1  ORF type:complete len:338 (-),score=70.33 GILK01001944.1:100-1035(-)
MSDSAAVTLNEGTRIGWIGTGVMGSSMCGHLLAKGYKVWAYNRSADKLRCVIEKGAIACSSPKEVAENSDIVFTIVGFPSDVREVIMGASGVLAGLKDGGILIDHTTSEPSLAKEIATAAAAKNIRSLDAPVSGGDIGASEARLSIMIGGDESTVETVRPLLQAYGTNIQYLGGPGSGQHTKMVNQILIANGLLGVCEGLLYGYKAGLDLENVIRAVGSGAAGSWQINNLGPRIIVRNFDPGFFIEHFIKDMGIALDEAKRMNLALPGLSLVHQFYVALTAHGHGRLGTQALALALENLNNVQISKKAPSS